MGREQMREVAAHEGLAHELPVGGGGGEILEAIGEAGEDLADVGHADLATDGRGAVGLEGLPESIARQIAEGQIGVVLVVVLSDQQEPGREAVAQGLAPRDMLGSGEPFVDQIEDGEQKQRLVRSLMRTPLLHRRGADVEVVEAFDGGGKKHGARKAEGMRE